MKFALLSLGAGAVGSLAANIPTHARHARDSSLKPVTVKGNAFFAGDDRFYIRGVDYQPGGSSEVSDPLANADNCKRDVEDFKKLGINTIRVYTVDNTAKHDECMDILKKAGIYVVLDVNTPKYSLNRAQVKASYNAEYLNSIFNTVEMFSVYDNTLAFFSGNEVINAGDNSGTAPYIKAVTRDIRTYLRRRGLRRVPVGYSAADIDSNRFEMAQYMNCGPKEERSDFFAFNDYSWCDPSSFQKSGWEAKTKNFSGYGLPLFLSEYGCNTNERKFEEVKPLYGKDMTAVYSGGLVYEYTEASNKYGLVKVDGDKVNHLKDYDALQKAFIETPNPKGDGGYNSTGGCNPCPKKNFPNWDVDPDQDLPEAPKEAKDYMDKGPGKAPGLSGPGSQAGPHHPLPEAGSSDINNKNSGGKATGPSDDPGFESGAPISSAKLGLAASVLSVVFGFVAIF